MLHKLFISVKCSTCFRQFLRPSSGAQKLYTTSGTLSNLYCYLPLLWKRWNHAVKVWQSTRCCIYSFRAPDDGRRNRLKHVEQFTEIKKLCNASRWLYLKIRLRCTDPWTSNLNYVMWMQCCVGTSFTWFGFVSVKFSWNHSKTLRTVCIGMYVKHWNALQYLPVFKAEMVLPFI